ncbi:ParB/RepB/Spo0J family partition protein [Massilia soli]|uniref:ParB/RepB/Spo0J family partition protein n=1 Tax=Massilia soli TaxID=2792854 RepID=A0ABS7SPX7_9BURK|nr:ParB/RepB/Spo0J family partition protein [Massilia soli]MBZ2207180.1 ParB/RepB/Spo0J family partition protein [Massilia soli]
MATRTSSSPVNLAGLDALADLGAVSYASLLQGDPDGRQRQSSAAPLLVPVSDIEERPHQVRQRFDLTELRASIRDNLDAGRAPVKTPLIVKPIPGHPGKWDLCDGARRLRAARLEGVTALPVIADPDFDDFDQVVVNLQRDANTPVEIADFIASKLATGRKQTEIARRLGKSSAWVSKHAALIGMPAPIRHAYDAGRIHDVEAMYLLVVAYKNQQASIDPLCMEGAGPISKYNVMRLLEEDTEPVAPTPSSTAADERAEGSAPNPMPIAMRPEAVDAGAPTATTSRARPASIAQTKPRPPPAALLERPLVQVLHEGRAATLLMAACAPGAQASIRYDATGHTAQVPIGSLTLTAIIAKP